MEHPHCKAVFGRMRPHSHGSAIVVKATTQVNGEMGNSTHCHAKTP